MRLKTKMSVQVLKAKIWALKMIYLYKMAPSAMGHAQEVMNTTAKWPRGRN